MDHLDQYPPQPHLCLRQYITYISKGAVLCKPWNNMTAIIYHLCYAADDLVLWLELYAPECGIHSTISKHFWLCFFFEPAYAFIQTVHSCHYYRQPRHKGVKILTPNYASMTFIQMAKPNRGTTGLQQTGLRPYRRAGHDPPLVVCTH